jgi:hypothetical protein
MPAAAATAAAARAVVLRGACDEDVPFSKQLDTGCFDISTSADVFASLCSCRPRRGLAFAGPWPWFEVDDAVVGPGLPVAVSAAECDGPDGVYRRTRGEVVREAGGREQTLVDLQSVSGATRAEVDLLWFGSAERYRVFDGTVEISDLFSRSRLPARRRRIEHWLVRQMRRTPEILEWLPDRAEGSARQSLEIARPVAVTDARWADPAAFFAARADVEAVDSSGSELVLHSVGGETVVFETTARVGGWSARRRAGPYIFETVSLSEDGPDLVVRVTPDPAQDLASATLRGRLAFDLSTDLIALSRR